MCNLVLRILIISTIIGCYSCSKKVYPVSTEPIDGDGNYYKTVIIGDQEWFAENLKTTKFNNGKEIKQLPINDGRASYYWYNNDTSYMNNYGALYNWNAVISNKLCPSGWKIPNKSD